MSIITIKANDCSHFIRNTDLFKLLLDEDNCVTVQKDKIYRKEYVNINSFQELMEILEIFRFWGVTPLPWSILRWIKDNTLIDYSEMFKRFYDYQEVQELITLTADEHEIEVDVKNNPFLSRNVGKKKYTLDQLTFACYNGYLELIKFILCDVYKNIRESHIRIVCARGHLDCLKYFSDDRYVEYDKNHLVHTIVGKNMDCARYLIEKGAKFGKFVGCWFDIFDKNNDAYSRGTLNLFVSYNNLEALKFVCEEVLKPGELGDFLKGWISSPKYFMDVLIKNNSYEFIKYITQFEEFTKHIDDINFYNLMEKAIVHDRPNILEHLGGFVKTIPSYRHDNMVNFCIGHKSVKCFEILMKKGVLFRGHSAAEKGAYQIFESYFNMYPDVNISDWIGVVLHLIGESYGISFLDKSNPYEPTEDYVKCLKLFEKQGFNFKEHEEKITKHVSKHAPPHIIDFFVERGFDFTKPECLELAIEKNTSLSIFHLIDLGCKLTKKCFEKAINNYNPDMVKRLWEKECPFDIEVIKTFIAKYPNTSISLFLVEKLNI